MNLKKMLCAAVSICILCSCMNIPVFAAVAYSESFSADTSEAFGSIVHKLNWNDESSDISVVEKYRGKKDADYSLKISENGQNTVNETGISIKNPTENTQYATNDSYYIQTLVYFPQTENTSLKITAGTEYTNNSGKLLAEAVQYLHPGGVTNKISPADTGGSYFQNGWNLISVHFNRDSAEQYRLRIYVNGVAGYINNKIYIDAGTPLEDIYMNLQLCDSSGEQNAINAYFMIDDAVIGNSVDVNRYFISLNENLSSDTYSVDTTAKSVSKIPDIHTAGEVKANLSGNEVYIATIAENGNTEIANDYDVVTDEMKIIFISSGRKMDCYSLKTAPTVDGVVIPTEDFVEDAYDSVAWNTETALSANDNGDILFETEIVDNTATVVTGDATSPYTVGGFWHFAFTDSLIAKKKIINDRDFYNIKSNTQAGSLTIRGQGANLDESKLTKGKYTVVEFAYQPSEKDYFNMNFRWKAEDTTYTSETLFSKYKAPTITFADDKKVYLGGFNGEFDSEQATEVCSWKPDTLYNVMLVFELPPENGNIVKVKSLILNGETKAENISFTATKSGITCMKEFDLFFKSVEKYNVNITNVKCYSTDEYMASNKLTPQEWVITLNGKKFILLDYFEDSNEVLVLTEDLYTEEKFDAALSRNHETLAKGIFDPTDEENIAYKLNNGFPLSSDIMGYVNTHSWSCDSKDAVNDSIVDVKFALLSLSEAKKYASKIGGNGTAGEYWWLRSRPEESVHDVYAVSLKEPNMIIKRKAHGKMHVRPVFCLDTAFFKNVKLDNIGKEAAKIIEGFTNREELLGIYSEDELNLYFERPRAVVTEIEGKTVVGETLTVKYDYVSDYEETSTAFQWYESYMQESGYEKIAGATSEKFTLTDDQIAKYIKVSVTPQSVSSVNPDGEETLSEMSSAKVFDDELLNAMIEDINDEPSDSLKSKLEEYNSFNNLDLSYNVSVMTPAMAILEQEEISDYIDLKNKYNASVALVFLNNASGEDVREKFTSSALMLNLNFFNRLKETEQTTVLENVDNQTYTNYSDFVKSVYELFAITEFTGADREQIFNLLSDYTDVFTTDYSDLSDYKLRLVASLLEGTYTSFSVLDTAVTNAVTLARNTASSENVTVNPGKPSTDGESGSGRDKGNVSIEGYTPEITETQVSVYNDLENVSWAVPMIEKLTEKGIVCGTGNGKFLPDNNIKREEFVKMLVLGFSLETENNIAFSDVSTGTWYEEYVRRAFAAGIVNGYEDGSFGIGTDISREDLAVMIYRCIKGKYEATGEAKAFTDADEISDYAREAFSQLSALGIISGTGDGAADPKGKATRAMAAKMLYLAMEVTGE